MRRLLLVLFVLLFLTFAQPAQAFSKQLYVSFAFPVRQFVNPNQSPLDLPKEVAKEATSSATPLTWYLDYDSLNDPTTSHYFKYLSLKPNQEVGVLLEITPRLLANTDISAGSLPIVLNSYLPSDRQRLIDRVFQKYFSIFDHYPSSVAAGYLDSFSLDYLHNHYSVVAGLFGSNLTSTTLKLDGVFPLFSYYPSHQNALIPAQDAAHRIKLNLSSYNPADLFGQSITSANIDQTLSDFALKDLNESTRLVLGTDNATPVVQYLPEFKKINNTIVNRAAPYSINRVTVSEFGNWFAQYYPLTSPAFHYRSTRADRTVVYYQNPFYQIMLVETPQGTQITNLTVFNQSSTEEFRQDRNLSNQLTLSVPSVVSNKNPIPIAINLTSAYSTEFWRLFLTAGDKKISFTPQQIITKNLQLDLPLSPQINRSATTKWAVPLGQTNQPINTYSFDSSWLPFHTSNLTFILNLLKLLVLLFVIFLVIRLFGINLKLEISNLSLLIIFLGSALWSLTTLKSGSHTLYGLSFWGPQGHDAFAHLSLIESFKHSLWPLVNPTLVNTTVINYHILFDLLTSIISKYLNISSLDLYFRFLPPFMAFLVGIMSVKLLQKWQLSPWAIKLSLLVVYTAGSLGFIPFLISSHSLFGGESVFWANQAVSTLLNPPFAFSLVLLLLWLNLVDSPLTGKRLIVLGLLGGILIQAKSYSAVLLLLSLGLLFIKNLLKRELTLRFTALIMLTGVFSLLFLLPIYSLGQSLFIFSPLWFIKSLISSPDRLPWPQAANALINYPVSGQILKYTVLETFLILLFFIGNLGIRLLSLPTLFGSKNKLLSFSLTRGIILFGCLIPLLFIQRANPWNTIQFFYYTLFFTALLTGPIIAKLAYSLQNLPQFLTVSFILILVTATTSAGTLLDYISPIPSSYIGYSELTALSKLSNLPLGRILSPEFNTNLSHPYTAPKPVFAYTTTSYISALTGQPSFIADETNLLISNYNFAIESQNQQRFYRTADYNFITNFLKTNNIKYVYENPQFHLQSRTQGPPPQSGKYSWGITPLFDSGYYKLYTVNK